MKILFVSPGYPPKIGGVEYVVKSVAERLVRAGHKVVVVSGEPSVEEPVEERVNGVKVFRWPTWSPGEAYHLPRGRSKLEQRLLEIAKKTDVVHLHSIHSVFTVYSLRVVKNRDVRIVVTPYYHGTGHTLVRRFFWIFWRKYVKSLLRGCIIHTVSRLEAKLVKKDFGVKAILIENGVEEWIRDLKWEPKDYVMYSGRIEKYKNIDLLARIVKVLNERYGLDLKFKVFGRGPYRGKLEEFLKSLRISYEMGNFKPFEAYIKTLLHAMLFGLLSEKESYPQSVNEANGIGVPVVVAKPWGLNFEGRCRTLIIDLCQDLDMLAENIYEFLRRVSMEEKSYVPTWSEVVREYMKKLYGESR